MCRRKKEVAIRNPPLLCEGNRTVGVTADIQTDRQTNAGENITPAFGGGGGNNLIMWLKREVIFVNSYNA